MPSSAIVFNPGNIVLYLTLLNAEERKKSRYLPIGRQIELRGVKTREYHAQRRFHRLVAARFQAQPALPSNLAKPFQLFIFRERNRGPRASRR
jgi:hypothetical protein